MAHTTVHLQAEPRLPVTPVIAALALCGAALVFLADATPEMPRQLHIAALAGLCYGAAAVCWLARGRAQAGRWLPVASLVALIFLGDRLLAAEGLLALLALPALLATPLIGLPAGLAVAAGESLLLLLYAALSPRGVATDPLVALVAIWGAFAILWSVQRSLQQAADWAWDYSERAHDLLEQARDRKVELGLALEDLAHANRQLALANERTAALRLIAEEAQKARTAFVSRVSHEFRTPLNMIIGLVGLIIRRPDTYAEPFPRKLWEDLQVVQRNCEHLASMVNDVLDLTRVESGRLTLHRQLVDLPRIIDSALIVVGPLLERKGLGLQRDLGQDLPCIACDPTRIRQVILNLLSNAARFTEHGQITIRAAGQGDSVLLSVSDTGPGMAPEEVSSVFEPFWQTGAAPSAQGGSGLGLSIARQFVELHGGRIWLESRTGIGTACHVQLPIAPPAAPAGHAWRWIREDWQWRERGFKGGRAAATEDLTRPCLVVLDETGAVQPHLERYADLAEFVVATSPEQARSLVAERPAQALLVNTADAGRLWPQLSALRGQVAQTALIGCALPHPEPRAVAAGALGHLIKPVGETDLAQALQATGRPLNRILLVDDDPEFLALLARMVQAADPHLEILTAGDGAQALEAVRSHQPDLVFLDIVMPEMDGWQVLERLRRAQTAQELPVYLLSAQDSEDQPPVSPCLIAAAGEDLPLGKVLRCSLQFAASLWEPA